MEINISPVFLLQNWLDLEDMAYKCSNNGFPSMHPRIRFRSPIGHGSAHRPGLPSGCQGVVEWDVCSLRGVDHQRGRRKGLRQVLLASFKPTPIIKDTPPFLERRGRNWCNKKL